MDFPLKEEKKEGFLSMKKGLRIGIRKFGRLATLNVYLETQECMEIFRYVL